MPWHTEILLGAGRGEAGTALVSASEAGLRKRCEVVFTARDSAKESRFVIKKKLLEILAAIWQKSLMAFDSTKPQNGTDLDAVEIRNQLNALNDLIAAQAAQIAALQVALANTAQNPAIAQMAFGLSDPPTQAQLQGIYDQLNMLTNLLVRV